MARLPFLVEHGPIVWQGLAAIAAVVAIAILRHIRARRERRATARELAARAAEATAPVEGHATVRGTLRGGRAASVSLLHLRGPRPYYDERAPELWLDCDGQRVELAGAIRVVRGTRAVSTRDRRSAVPDDELAVRSSPILHRLPALAVSVRDGDEVFATARLLPRPAAEVRGYREATTVWQATADRGELEIHLVAAAPVARAIPLGRTRGAALGAAAAGLAIAALWAAGGVALSWARPGTGGGHRIAARLGELDALSLAAATPGHRVDALAALEARFATGFQRTPEAFALWRRVAQLRGGCGGELEARIAQGEIDGLAELAQRCDDDRAAGDAYQLLGLFREAAARDAELPAVDQHIESLIAIGAWQRAGWWAGTQHHRASVRSPAPFACAEQWFRWLAGFRPTDESRARLPHGDPACKVIAALSHTGDGRARALADAALDPAVEAMADALAWADGAPRDATTILPIGRIALHRAMFDPGNRTTIARALLSRPALAQARLTLDAPGALTWLAVREMLSGDLPRARASVRDLATRDGSSAWPFVFRGHDREMHGDGHALDVAFALRAAAPLPELVVDRRVTGDLRVPIRDPDLLWRRYEATYWGPLLGRQTCDGPGLGPAGDLRSITLRAARSGNGRELAEWLARCRLDDAAASGAASGAANGAVNGAVIEAVFAVWPKIREGRDRLADAIRTIDLGPPATDPLTVIGHAAMRRDLARLTGDTSRADAWQAIALRHLEAFSSYTALSALMVRELLRTADPGAR